MRITGKLIGALLMTGAALFGSYVGEALHSSGTAGTAVSSRELDMDKLIISAIPGVILALIAGWPRMFYAFLGGLLTAVFLGSRGASLEQLSDLAAGRKT